MTEKQVRQGAAAIAIGRGLLGAAALALPGLSARAWMGDAGEGPGMRVAVRGMAARDLGLALGLGDALRRDGDVAAWLLAGAAADAGDVVAALADGRRLSRRAQAVGLGAAAATALGLVLAARAADRGGRRA